MSTPPNNQGGPSTGRSKGRQKVNMVKMEKKSNLQVTYSKRRSGLFKKASELCTLCGAEAAIVVFSPAEKAYCFGHPDVKTILERFENGDNNTNVDSTMLPGNTALPPFSHERRSQELLEAHRNSTMRELNLEYTQVEAMLRAERLLSQELKAMKKQGQAQHWIPPPLDGFNYDQLAILRETIMGFKKKVDEKVEKELMSITGNDNHPPLPDVGNYNQDIDQQVFQAGVGTLENLNTMVFGHDGNDNHPPLPNYVGNYNQHIDQQVFQAGVGAHENPNTMVFGHGGNDSHPPLPDVGNYNQHIDEQVFETGVRTHENPNTMVFGHGGDGVRGDGNNVVISGGFPLYNININDHINQHLLQGGGGTENPNPSVFGDNGGGVGGNVSDIDDISGGFPTFNNVGQMSMMNMGSTFNNVVQAPMMNMESTFNNVAQTPMMNLGSSDLTEPWPAIGFGTNDAAQYQAPLEYHHDPMDAGASSYGGDMFFGGGNNSSSSGPMLQHNPNDGSGGFGTSGGFNGYDHGMF